MARLYRHADSGACRSEGMLTKMNFALCMLSEVMLSMLETEWNALPVIVAVKL